MWNRNMDILAKGYFLVSREAFKLFRVQKTGGNVVFIASKNALAASPNKPPATTPAAPNVMTTSPYEWPASAVVDPKVRINMLTIHALAEYDVMAANAIHR